MKTPIVIFSFNRPLKLYNLLCFLNKQTADLDKIPVILFQDGYQREEDKSRVEDCIKVFKQDKNLKQKILIQRSSNYGLQKNIETALSSVFMYYERAIVLEDDLMLSNIFIDDMIDMLNTYQNDERINSVTGLSINDYTRYSDILNTTFSSLGWATWRSRWLDKCNNDFYILIYLLCNRKKFDLANRYPHSTNFIYNMFGLSSSWAIYMHATVVIKKKFVVYSKFETVSHDGTDILATHYTTSHSSHIQNSLINHDNYRIQPRHIREDHAFEDKLLNYNLKCSPIIKSLLSALKIVLVKFFTNNA